MYYAAVRRTNTIFLSFLFNYLPQQWCEFSCAVSVVEVDGVVVVLLNKAWVVDEVVELDVGINALEHSDKLVHLVKPLLAQAVL